MSLVSTGSRRWSMPSSRGSTCSRRLGPGVGCRQGWRAELAGHPGVRRTGVRRFGVRCFGVRCCSQRTVGAWGRTVPGRRWERLLELRSRPRLLTCYGRAYWTSYHYLPAY